MALIDEFAKQCVLMEKQRVPDGEGGYITSWVESIEFENYQTLNTSMEARIAQKQGVTSVYSALVKKNVPIEYGDVFKDKTTGITYRITSNPDEKKSPKSASFDLKYFTAERWELAQ